MSPRSRTRSTSGERATRSVWQRQGAMIDPLSKWMYKRSGPLAGSLTFLGLSMAWFSAFLYVCVQNGVSSTSFPEVEMPSRLFALGSVYGMQRPTIEVAWRTTCAGLFGMLALGVCDLLYARKTKARWFGLHTIANMWISVLCLPDCWFLVSDPITALTTRSCNHWPTALVFSVHVYHVAFFRNLHARWSKVVAPQLGSPASSDGRPRPRWVLSSALPAPPACRSCPPARALLPTGTSSTGCITS